MLRVRAMAVISVPIAEMKSPMIDMTPQAIIQSVGKNNWHEKMDLFCIYISNVWYEKFETLLLNF